MQDFKKLIVWKKAHQLVLEVYERTRSFPPEEKYGLTAQMRRSCSSVPTNIAEGTGRGSNGQFRQFLEIAMGSSSELDYQIILARDLGYLDYHSFVILEQDISEVRKMLRTLIERVSKKTS